MTPGTLIMWMFLGIGLIDLVLGQLLSSGLLLKHQSGGPTERNETLHRVTGAWLAGIGVLTGVLAAVLGAGGLNQQANLLWLVAVQVGGSVLMAVHVVAISAQGRGPTPPAPRSDDPTRRKPPIR